MDKNIIKKIKCENGKKISKPFTGDAICISEDVRLKTINESGSTAGIRHESETESYTVDYTNDKNDKFVEQNKVKKIGKRKYTKFEMEQSVVNRLLPIYNQLNKSNFVILPNQPLEPADVSIEDQAIPQKVGVQIVLSDFEPSKPLSVKKFFGRSGTGFTIHHDAIKIAIKHKLKYPLIERTKLILVLDGWQGVRKEDLDYFRKTESDFTKASGYKEIWFVGYDIVDCLFP